MGSQGGGGESLGQLTLGPDEGDQTPDHDEQPERDDHRVQDRSALDGPDDRALDERPHRPGQGQEDEEDQPVVGASRAQGQKQGPADEGDEEGHLALGEVEDVRAPVDEDDAQGD